MYTVQWNNPSSDFPDRDIEVKFLQANSWFYLCSEKLFSFFFKGDNNRLKL